VSESEGHQIIGKLTDQKEAAESRLSEIDENLEELGERLEKLGSELRKRPATLEKLRDLLGFGPDSMVKIEGLLEMLGERKRLQISADDCAMRLRNLGT
jgi:hypothetical protein